MKKEHFEVLLENMTDKIDLVLEGHAVLNNKIDNVQQDVNELRQDVNDLRNGVIDFRKENETAHTALDKKMDTRKNEVSDIKRRVSRLEAARA